MQDRPLLIEGKKLFFYIWGLMVLREHIPNMLRYAFQQAFPQTCISPPTPTPHLIPSLGIRTLLYLWIEGQKLNLSMLVRVPFTGKIYKWFFGAALPKLVWNRGVWFQMKGNESTYGSGVPLKISVFSYKKGIMGFHRFTMIIIIYSYNKML